jgi:hypothetical protein
MKKAVSLLLTLLMALSIAAPAWAQAAQNSSEENPWSKLDLSKYEEINFYVVGVQGNDWQEMVDAANELMLKKINTKVNFIHVSWGDFQSKYSLFLSGDEDVDLIYGAAWCNYANYVKAGAYKGFDWNFVQTYMPLTAQSQAASSWKEAEYNGQYYCVPRDDTGISWTGVITKQALLDKYGFKATDINSYEKLADYYSAIAAGEQSTGVYAFNPQGSYPLDGAWYTTRYHYMDVNAGAANWMVWKYNTGKAFDVNDLKWFADTDDYLTFCLQMADFYKKGVFPSSVISNSTMLDDNFRAGTSATQYSVPSGLKGWQDALPNDTLAYLNPFWDDQSVTRRGNYMGYGACFPVASKKMERAAVALDCMKNDPEVNRLLVGGIEGRHYVLDKGTNTYTLGSEAADYGWGSWCYLLQHDEDPKLKLSDDMQAMQSMYEAKEVPVDTFPVNGFTYDSTKFDAELAVISSLLNEYRFSFCFGIFGDQTEAKYHEFIDQCKAAGLDEIVQDYRDQLAAYIAK